MCDGCETTAQNSITTRDLMEQPSLICYPSAILRGKMNDIEDWNAKRKQSAPMPTIGWLSHQACWGPSIRPRRSPSQQSPCERLKRRPQAFSHLPSRRVRAERRDELRAFLTKKNSGSEMYYPVPLHLQQCFRIHRLRRGRSAGSERAAKISAFRCSRELTSEEQATRWCHQLRISIHSWHRRG